jgi:ribose transport system substrate-binding protein
MESIRPARKIRRGVVGAVALVLALSGCSTGGDTAGPSSGTENAVAAAVTDNVAKYKGLPTFTPPGEPIDPSTLRGKSMFLIPLVPNPFNQNIQETMQGIAEKVGMNFTIYPNQGTPSEWVQGMNAALTAKPDIIVLSTAPDPRTLQPQLEQAKAAGIPVLVTHFYDDSSPVPPDCEGCAAGVTALVTAPFNVAGKAAADWIIADSKGNANVLLIGGADVLPSPATLDTISKEFADQCPACKVTVKNIPVSDWNTKAQGEVQSALYDAMVAGAVPAVQTLGKTGQVKVVSYNGSPYALKYIQDGDIVAMNVGEDTVGIGYTSMDQAFRILLGKPTVDERTPIRIWDKTNVNEAGVPPEVGKGYGSALSDGFLQLWGLPAAP